ncbi:MAG: amidohydrolase family protein [Chloroflexota bacterium]
MTNPIALDSSYRYVLEGRVVTMGTQGVLDDGTIFVEDGVIRGVQSVDEPVLSGFESAQRIRTGDTLYPGLIELHNHLPYNAIPLWQLSERFSNNGQWRSRPAYRRNVSGPARVLGQTTNVVEALIRFVECRCLLGATTTSQGVTLNSVGTRSFFPGLVRNVEAPLLPNVNGVGTRIANPPNDEEEKRSYLERLAREDCYLQHLSEGTDDTARGWFLRLQMNDGNWAINQALCGIHSTALHRTDFEVMAAHNASMVWSPTSNYLLYGGTADLQAVADSGIQVGLGSDWGPSGSKNLLGELKVAWLASEEAGGVFSAERLVQMATRDAAEILHWGEELGTLESNKRADIIAINGKMGDPYQHLIEARETGVTLVVIDGIPRVGQPRLMNRFALLNPEDITVGNAKRILHLHQDNVHPLVADLTLTEATQRLQDALRNLPQLAAELENAVQQGLDAGAVGSPLSVVGIDLEFQEEFALTGAAEPLSTLLFPMELEPITVADDPHFLGKLAASPNLPPFIVKNLPALYGEPMPEPFVATPNALAIVGLPPSVNATVQQLQTFLRSDFSLTKADRLRIVAQALMLLTENYVHLPLKQAMYGIDPVQQLRLLQYQIEQQTTTSADSEFHTSLTKIFHSLRDLHTTYRLPYPFSRMVAWLPFYVEEYWDAATETYRYIISKVIQVTGRDVPENLHGAELLYWNGTAIADAIAIHAEQLPGGNRDARRVRGLNSLTLRPLGHGLPPIESWVEIRYQTADGDEYAWSQEWYVFMPQSILHEQDMANTAIANTAIETQTAVGMDGYTDAIQDAKKILFSSGEVKKKAMFASTVQDELIMNGHNVLPTTMPTIIRARHIKTDVGLLGHLRIFSFNVPSAESFVAELGRILATMPKTGVLIDIRGNGGGSIPAAEGALQLLTPQSIEPQHAQFINTPLNLRLCENSTTLELANAQLDRWTDSIRQAIQTGAVYSAGFPITESAWLAQIQQQYFGPVALITDALCYSAADIFASGFQDHAMGPVIGVHDSTGAGGANVWSYRLLQHLAAEGSEPIDSYLPLPEGADFNVAVRRLIRTGLNAGDVLEDFGVRVDTRHHMTQHDLMNSNADLLNTAAQTLVDWHMRRPTVHRQGDDVTIQIPEGSSAELGITMQAHPFAQAQQGTVTFNLQELLRKQQNDVTLKMTVEDDTSGQFTHFVNLNLNEETQL